MHPSLHESYFTVSSFSQLFQVFFNVLRGRYFGKNYFADLAFLSALGTSDGGFNPNTVSLSLN